MADQEPDILDAARQKQETSAAASTDEQAGINERYRRAAKRLGELLDRNGCEQVNIRRIKILGSPHTRQGFLSQVIAPSIAARSDGTLKGNLDGLAEAANKLSKLDIFDAVALDIDASPLSQSSEPREMEATIRLKERSRMWFRTGTDFGNQEGNAYASANLRNVFGGAETLEGNITFGTRTKTSYEVKFVSPIAANPDCILELAGYGSSKINTYASHNENIQGCSLKVKRLGRWAYHEYGLLAADRQITSVHDGASLSVRQSAGTTRKTSLFNTLSRDQRDNSILPTSGYKLRSSQELAVAGLAGSDAAFLKLELDGSQHTALSQDAKSTLNLAFRTGLLLSRKSDGSTLLNDRFQLGGPQSVRGFLYNGLGPRDGKDSLGGTGYLATGISLMTPVPRAPESWPIRLHSFINTGSLIDVSRYEARQRWRELLLKPSISAGLGLAFEHPMARLEVSFCLPIACRSSDRTRKGLQFGLGIEFL